MGVKGWFQDIGVMMMRTKPQYLSVLGRKRSSIRSPNKPSVDNEKKCGLSLNFSVCFIIMFCSISYGIILLLLEEVTLSASTLLIPLILAAVCSFLGGTCLAEYISQHIQEVPSIYSCCYQYSSEILAFFVGWSWLLSQTAMIASLCKVLVLFVSHWSGDSLLKILEKTFSTYADAIPCTMFVIAFYVFVFTGFGSTIVWYVVFIPVGFTLVVIAVALTHISNNENFFSFDGTWLEIRSVDQILTATSFCLLFFTGPQSILRLSQKQIRQKTITSLGLLNVIGFFLVSLLLTTCSKSGKLLHLQLPPDNPVSLATCILIVVSLSILVIEAFHPLHFVIEDMSSDGLLFRTFSKKWKPICFSVASPQVQLLTMISILLLAIFVPISTLLSLVVLFPVLVSTFIPMLVLNQRYRDNTSWQYEPMFQTTAKNIRTPSRQKSQESQYTNGIGFDNNESLETSTTCIDEESTDGSSDTDIDSMVQQYRDQAKIANMPVLEEHGPSDQVPEPTPSSAFRAKLCITALFITSIVNGMALNIMHLDQYFTSGVVVLICLLFSTVVQGMLLYLPQNKTSYSYCCSKWPSLPWIPGMASFCATSLLLHCLLTVWEIYLGWILFGFTIYFLYGMRSSTAANSFYNLRPSHIALRPMPSYGNNCVTQVVPSQRKSLKQLKNQKNTKKKILM